MINKGMAIIIIISALALALLGSVAVFYVKYEPQALDFSFLDKSDNKPVIKEQIATTSNEPVVGQVFSVAVTPGTVVKTKEIKLMVDGKQVGSCLGSDEVCKITIGPFTKEDIGEHTYVVLLTDEKGGETGSRGGFTVTDEKAGETGVVKEQDVVVEQSSVADNVQSGQTQPKPADQAGTPVLPKQDSKETEQPKQSLPYPQYEKIITSNSNVKVGEMFLTTIYAKNVVPIEKIEIVLSGKVVTTCKDTLICGDSLGPVSENLVGQKVQYKYILTGTNGQVTTVTLYFWVVAATKYQAPQISITPSSLSVDSNSTISFYASVAPGSEILSSTDIIVNKKIVKSCTTATCNYVGGPYPEYAGSNVVYAATAHFQNGTSLTTGYNSVSINPVVGPLTDEDQPPVTDTEPAIEIVAQKASISSSETVEFGAVASAGSKVFHHLNIYINGPISKTCYELTCVYLGGPYPEYAGKSLEYKAAVFFDDGTYKVSAVKFLPVSASQDDQPPVTDTEPAIEIVAQKASISSSETVEFGAVASAGSKVFHHLNIYINGPISKTCYELTCVYLGGPYPEYAGKSLEYKAAVFFDDGTYKVSAVKFLPVTGNQYIEPKVTVTPSQDIITPEDTVVISVDVVPGSKTVDYIHIIINQKLEKTCQDVNICSFTGGPYPDYSGLSISYGGNVYFTDGTNVISGYKPISVKSNKYLNPSAQKDSVAASEKNSVFVTIWPFDKLNMVEVYANGKKAGTCLLGNCLVDVGPFPEKAGSYVNYYAVSYYLDGQAPFVSETKQFYVKPFVQPTVGIEPYSNERPPYDAFSSITFTATANSGDETLGLLTIYLNAKAVKGCSGATTCSYTTTPQQVFGFVPLVDTNLTYQAQGTFSNGTKTVTTPPQQLVIGGLQIQ